MSIVIKQMCDGCGDDRTLDLPASTEDRDLNQSAEAKGWRSVLGNKHLCPKCIKNAITQ